jgi:hypothetical protein
LRWIVPVAVAQRKRERERFCAIPRWWLLCLVPQCDKLWIIWSLNVPSLMWGGTMHTRFMFDGATVSEFWCLCRPSNLIIWSLYVLCPMWRGIMHTRFMVDSARVFEFWCLCRLSNLHHLIFECAFSFARGTICILAWLMAPEFSSSCAYVAFQTPSFDLWICLLPCDVAACILDSWLMVPELKSYGAYVTL